MSRNIENSSTRLRRGGRLPAAALVLTLLILAVYLQTLGFEFVKYDDSLYVTENPVVRRGITVEGLRWAFTNVDTASWAPLTLLSHMLDVQLFGLNPRGHHLTNIVIHIAVSLLLLLLLVDATSSFWRSFLVAALFALHPLQVETVAWISSRKGLLSGLFFLLSLWSWFRYVGRRSFPWYWASLLFFLFGLMAKAMLVTAPFVLLLTDYWPSRRFGGAGAGEKGHSALFLLREKAPFFFVAAAFSALTYVAQQGAGAVKDASIYPLWTRLGNGVVAYVSYLLKTLLPLGLAVPYPHRGTELEIWKIALSAVVLAAVTVCVFARRSRRGYLLVGWLWFLGMLVPVIGIVQVGVASMADRYMYLPLIGLLTAVVWGLPEPGSAPMRRAYAVAAALLVALSAAASWRQAGYWRSEILLFTRSLEVTSDNFVAHNNLGEAYASRGRMDEALAHFVESVRIVPDQVEANFNAGQAMLVKGKAAEALPYLRRALWLSPGKGEIHAIAGSALFTLGRYEEALFHYRAALGLDPGNAAFHSNVATALAATGKAEEAVAYYRRAIEIDPALGDGHFSLGSTLLALGRAEEAFFHFSEALRLNPGDADAHNQLGLLLARKGESAKAAAHFRKAIEIDPAFTQARRNLAALEAGAGAGSGGP